MADLDKKIKALEEENAALQTQLAEKSAELEAANAANAASQKNIAGLEKLQAELIEEIGQLKVEADKVAETLLVNASLEEAITTQAEEIQSLTFHIEGLSKGGKPTSLAPKEFELDGQTYPFPAPSFLLNNKKVTAEEALENPEILRQLVEVKAGGIA